MADDDKGAIRSMRFTITMILGLAFAGILTQSCWSVSADTAGDKRRAQLKPVKRLLIVPPFFATETLGELSLSNPPNGKPLQKQPEDEKHRTDRAEYVSKLKQLQQHAQTKLVERCSARLPFEIVSQADTMAAMKRMMCSSPQLFQVGGHLTGKRFDIPNSVAVTRLAHEASADAILVGSLDEPRKSNGGYYFDPLAGPGYESPKVNDRAEFNLMLADGTLVLRLPLDVLHPLTKLGNRIFLLADWLETEDLLIEDLMDEIARYTPLKRQE